MGFLDRISSARPGEAPDSRAPRPDRFDPFLGDSALQRAYRSLTGGDWNKLEEFLASSPKAWLFNTIITSSLVGLETVTFERWVDVDHSPRSRAVRAAVHIRDALGEHGIVDHPPVLHFGDEERDRDERDRLGRLRLHGPPPELQNRLKQIEEDLFEVAADAPDLADPWVFLLMSGRGRRLHLDNIRERFDNAHSRDPFRPDACRLYLQSLSKKWGGSNIATFDFARWIEDKAPPASAAREALPITHIEYGILQGGEHELAEHLTRPEVMAELRTSLTGFLQASPTPAFTEVLGVLNAYAIALNADSPDTSQLLVDTFAKIDNRPTEYPWALYGSHITHYFSEIQAEQLRAAHRH